MYVINAMQFIANNIYFIKRNIILLNIYIYPTWLKVTYNVSEMITYILCNVIVLI